MPLEFRQGVKKIISPSQGQTTYACGKCRGADFHGIIEKPLQPMMPAGCLCKGVKFRFFVRPSLDLKTARFEDMICMQCGNIRKIDQAGVITGSGARLVKVRCVGCALVYDIDLGKVGGGAQINEKAPAKIKPDGPVDF